MSTHDVIILARKYRNRGGMASSARLCLEDAVRLEGRGELELAKVHALKSLRYSIGILHADYQKAAK